MDLTLDPGEAVSFRPIGVIRSPFTRAEDAPVQPRYASNVTDRAEVQPEFRFAAGPDPSEAR